jgi:secondary thiamine-phosphate synthase enzyme
MQESFNLSTSKKQELIDITSRVNSIIKKSKVKQGICNIFTLHATAAIIINENWDPNICLDLIDSLNNQIPGGKWRHDKVDGNADSHIKSAMLGPGETVPISNGQLQLGKWQALQFCELDGPRSDRRIMITVIGDVK